MLRFYLIGIISLFLSFNTSHAAGKAKDKDEKQAEEATPQSDENAGPDLDSPPSPPWYDKIPVIRIRGEDGNRVAFDGLRLRTGLGSSEHTFSQSSENSTNVFPPQADFMVTKFPFGFNLESLVYEDKVGLRMNWEAAGYSTKIANDAYDVWKETFNAAVVYRHTFDLSGASQPTENVEQASAPETVEKDADKKKSKAKKKSKGKEKSKTEDNTQAKEDAVLNPIPAEKPFSDSKTKIGLEGMLGYNQTSNIAVEYSNKNRTGAKTMDVPLSGVELGLGAVYRIYKLNLRASLSETFAPTPVITKVRTTLEYEVMQLPIMEAVLLIHADAGMDWSRFDVAKEPDSTLINTTDRRFNMGVGLLW